MEAFEDLPPEVAMPDKDCLGVFSFIAWVDFLKPASGSESFEHP